MAATAEDGIRLTLARYCQLCDDGRFDEWSDLFTEQARFHALDVTHTGRGDVQAFIEAGQPPEQRGRHLLGEPVIEADAPGTGSTARAWTDFIFVDRHREITSVGRYHDELERGDDGRWRFALREIVFLGGEAQLTRRPI